MKRQKIKSILDQASQNHKGKTWLSETKKNELVDKLSELEIPDSESIREIVHSDGDIKESIDFSDTNYLISQLIKLVNEDKEDNNKDDK